MHIKFFNILYLVLWVSTWAPAVMAAEDDPVARLQEAYTKAIQALEEKNTADRQRTLAKYDGVCTKMEDYFIKRSDLDSILVLRKEKERLASSKKLTQDDVVSSPAKLANLQKQVLSRLDQLHKAHAKAIIAKTDSFAGKGKKEIELLVKEDKIDKAIELRNALKTFKENPPYQQALAILQQSQDAPPPPRKSSSPREITRKPNDLVTSIKKEFGTTKIYRKGAHVPRISGKRENLIFTSKESRGASMRMQAMVNLSEKPREISLTTPGSRDAHVVKGKAAMPRIKFTAGPKACENCVVYIEYFIRRGGHREKAYTESIPVGDFKPGESLTIDAAGFIPDQVRQHLHQDGTSHKVSAMHPVGDYGGLIVSVYDGNETMVFQRCTYNGLVKFATTTPPQTALQPVLGNPH